MTSAVFWGLILVAVVTTISKGEVAMTDAASGAASTYIRWGSSNCPNDSELVYSGEVGGGVYYKSGAAANILCLPTDPSYPDHDINTVKVAQIYHVEYSIAPDTRNHQHVLCAVCRVPRSTSVMIPASVCCPPAPGWKEEYRGYLMSDLPQSDRNSVEFVCVDLSLEGKILMTTPWHKYGRLYHTETQYINVLPCPKVKKLITGCIVCSK